MSLADAPIHRSSPVSTRDRRDASAGHREEAGKPQWADSPRTREDGFDEPMRS